MPISFDDLPGEVWKHILESLVPSLPKPLSGWSKVEAVGEPEEVKASLPDVGEAGATTRKDIRAPELATLMRTSIAFNHLASVPLHRRIITDRFHNLVKDIHSPAAHPSIPTKRNLLALTQSLHLEYSQKGVEPTYPEIFADGEDLWLLGNSWSIDMAAVQGCEEVMNLEESFTTLKTFTAFPHLRAVTIAAIFGPQRLLWAGIDANVRHGAGIPLRATRRAFGRMLQTAPIEHICQRGSSGPLSLPDLIDWSNKTTISSVPAGPSPLFTFHFDTQCEIIPVAVGLPTHWVLEEHCRREALRQLLPSATRAIHLLCDFPELRASKKRIDLTIFCTSSHSDSSKYRSGLASPYKDPGDLTAEDERKWCQKTNDAMRQTWYDTEGRPRDALLSWQSWRDSPPCLACVWSCPPLAEKGEEREA